MTQFRNALRLLPALLLLFALSGCDSGGGGGETPLDDLSVEVEGPSGTGVSLSTTFFYSESNGFCLASRTGIGTSVPEVPFNQSVEAPDNVNCDSDPGDFDGVRVTVNPVSGGSPELTVRLLSDGETVDEATDPTTTNNISQWVVEAGEVRSLGDLSGR